MAARLCVLDARKATGFGDIRPPWQTVEAPPCFISGEQDRDSPCEFTQENENETRSFGGTGFRQWLALLAHAKRLEDCRTPRRFANSRAGECTSFWSAAVLCRFGRRQGRNATSPASAEADAALDSDQTLNLNSRTSPSFTTYSLPSIRYKPFSRAAATEPHCTRAS
jgi:hypothetical protein